MTLRPLREDEVELAADYAILSFGDGDRHEVVELTARRAAAGELWGWAPDGVLLGTCRLLRVDHWFGGRRVPAQNVASVAVPPEHRGRGAASGMMAAAARAGADAELGLSLLFPATTRLYRRLGWEHAGTFSWCRLDARRAPVGGPPMRAASEADWAAIVACHQRWSALHNGPAVRPDERWERLRAASFAYVLDGDGGALDAYVVYDHRRAAGDWQYTLAFADWAAVTPQGLQAVAALVGRHGTLGKDVTFRGTVPDLWSLLTVEQDVATEGGFYWMARGLDLPVAVAERGFPPALETTVSFVVRDPVVPAGQGPWRLHVAGGRGRIEPAGAGEVRLDARAVGPLYTGFRSPRQLRLAGLLDGSDEALDRLGAAFAGPLPLLFDFF